MKLQTSALVSHLVLVLSALVSSSASGFAASGTPFCFGDGTGQSCPCSNSGFPGHGCRNGKFVQGGLLFDTGLASVSSDTLVLTGNYISGKAFVVSGTSQLAFGNGVPFGDGLRCVGGSTSLTKLKVPSGAGVVSFPAAGQPPLSLLGRVSPGSTRHYQILYQDKKLLFCTPKKDNGTNGLSVVWVP